MGFCGSLVIVMGVATGFAVLDCVEVSQHQAFRRAFAVFRGTAVQVRNLCPPDRSEPELVTFRVDRRWKGPVTETMRVFAFGSSSYVDRYSFHEGQRYVVYATNEARKWGFSPPADVRGAVYGISNPCLLRVRTDIDDESRRLGRGHPPKPDPKKPRAGAERSSAFR